MKLKTKTSFVDNMEHFLLDFLFAYNIKDATLDPAGTGGWPWNTFGPPYSAYSTSASLSFSDDLIAIITGEDGYPFEHVFELRTGKYLGLKEEFTFQYELGKSYWFVLHEDTDMNTNKVYYKRGSKIIHVKTLPYSGIEFNQNEFNNPKFLVYQDIYKKKKKKIMKP